jgi:hypothetical protein
LFRWLQVLQILDSSFAWFQLLHKPWKYKLLQTSGKSKLLPLQLANATGNAWRLSQHNHLK